MICRRQVITRGMDGEVVDISIPTIMAVMDVNNIKNKQSCLSKVINTFHHFLSERLTDAG